MLYCMQDSSVVEQEFIGLRDEALVTLDQSEQDLAAALGIRNRSMALLQLTQKQLLDVESKHGNLLLWPGKKVAFFASVAGPI